MTEERDDRRRPRALRLPGFVSDDEVGLGQAITYATSRVGIKQCGGCRRRAAALDRRVVFTPRKRT